MGLIQEKEEINNNFIGAKMLRSSSMPTIILNKLNKSIFSNAVKVIYNLKYKIVKFIIKN